MHNLQERSSTNWPSTMAASLGSSDADHQRSPQQGTLQTLSVQDGAEVFCRLPCCVQVSLARSERQRYYGPNTHAGRERGTTRSEPMPCTICLPTLMFGERRAQEPGGGEGHCKFRSGDSTPRLATWRP
jgi:hypothetical protein